MPLSKFSNSVSFGFTHQHLHWKNFYVDASIFWCWNWLGQKFVLSVGAIIWMWFTCLMLRFSGDLPSSAAMIMSNWKQRIVFFLMVSMPRLIFSLSCAYYKYPAQLVFPLFRSFLLMFFILFVLQLLGCHGPLANRQPGRAFLEAA